MSYTIVESSSGVPRSANMLTVLIDSALDAENLPADAAPGSIAFTPTLGYVAIKGNDGLWHERAVVDATTAANNAASAATLAAGDANDAATAANGAAALANTAASGATAYATEYASIDADIKLMYVQFQAYIRYLEKRVTALEAKVAALTGS